jgi:hypothetical protein
MSIIPHPYLYATLEIIPPKVVTPLSSALTEPSPTEAEEGEASTLLVVKPPTVPPVELTTLEDFFLFNAEEDEPEDKVATVQKRRYQTTNHSADKFTLLKLKQVNERQRINRCDAQELHDAKVRASGWACIPFLPAMIGIPFLPTLFYAFRSPQEQAAKREDERRGYRSLANATEHEQAIKTAQVKATLIPCTFVTLGILGREQLPFQRELTQPFKKMMTITTLERLETWLPKVLETLSWLALAMPIATLIWDKATVKNTTNQD